MAGNNPIKLTVDDFVQLVKEVEKENTIDWGMLAIDEEAATKLIALGTLKMYNEMKSLYDGPERELVLLASISNLQLENFCLNLKYLQCVKAKSLT